MNKTKTIIAPKRGGGRKTVSYRPASKKARLFASATAAACIALATGATLTARAADWTGADGNGYTALESIKGDGSAYVVTDIVPTLTDVVKMRFKTPNADFKGETLFCSRKAWKSKSFVAAFGNDTNKRPNKLRIDRGNAEERFTASALAKNTEYLMSVNYGDGSKDGTVTLNGSAAPLEGALDPTTDSPAYGLVFFALNNAQTTLVPGYYGKHYMHWFELYDSSGKLKNCLMPAKSDSDSAAGLYDTRTGVFYPGTGTGAFETAARTASATGQGVKWTGRGDGSSMSDGANWEGGSVPEDGDDLDFTLAPPLAEIDADISGSHNVWIADKDAPAFNVTGGGTFTFNDTVVAVGNTGVTSLPVNGKTTVEGAGGVKLTSFSIPATGRLVFDPIATPIRITAAPTFASGGKIALSSAYAEMTLGRVVLMTYKGTATFDQTLFDSSSIAAGALFTLTEESAPESGYNQLVLTVGDYANEAKEISILPIGDSITQGVRCTAQGDYPQYRTTIAARLAAAGYKPVMKGIWWFAQSDASGALPPDEWRWHCGVSGDRICTAGNAGGVRDNIHVYLDAAGYTDVVTLLIGTNDLGGNDPDPAETVYANFKALVGQIATECPSARIVGATLLNRNTSATAATTGVKTFNTLLRADYANGVLPAQFTLLDLNAAVPLNSDNFYDNLHMNWAGCALAGSAFADKIKETLPLATFTPTADPTVTDTPQTALGAANIDELAAYRSGMTHAYTIDATEECNSFAKKGFAPYTATNLSVQAGRPVLKAGYFVEIVRKGTNRRRWVWVDFDAEGKSFSEVDFPWNGNNMHFVARKLHVRSNDPSIHTVAPDDDAITGVIEGTWHDYSKDKSTLSGVPDDANSAWLGWNDTLGTGTTAGYGCFQAHRIFSQTGSDTHWNDGEVLFAWDRWASSPAKADEIGIGSYACHVTANDTANDIIRSMDYTFTSRDVFGLNEKMSASAYQVRHVEIWVELGEVGPGIWSGDAGDGNMATPGNWLDGNVPGEGQSLNFAAATSTINANISPAPVFGSVDTDGAVVTFTGTLTAKSFADTSKISVGENSTVTLDGDLTASGAIVYRTDGDFVVTGTITQGEGALFPTKVESTGRIVAGGLVKNNQAWDFRPNISGKTANWVIGAGGVSGDKVYYQHDANGGQANFQPLDSDFAITDWLAINKAATFDTSDYRTGAARRITVGDGTLSGGGIYRAGTVAVKGTGTLLCNYDAVAATAAKINGDATYGIGCANPFTVGETATLALASRASLGTGRVTVGSGATLAVAESGTVALGGALTCAAGSTLKFNFTTRSTAPKLVLSQTPTFSEVKVSLSGVRPAYGTDGKHTIIEWPEDTTWPEGFDIASVFTLADNQPKWVTGIAVEGDSLVLTSKPAGIMIFVQ